ncbi:MAG: PIN domain-containing protein [Alphaproteobacteria bacterium]
MGRETEEAKRARAAEILESVAFGLSVQVLQEFFTRVIRPPGTPLPRLEAIAWVERLIEYPCVPVDVALVRRGIALSERYQIHYWDGAILAAAEALGATTLYSEDLSHGQIYGSVRVVNPFLAQ